MLPIVLCVFGPTGAFVEQYVADTLFSLEGIAGLIGIGLIVVLCPALVITGMYMALIATLPQISATYGNDGFATVVVSVSSFSIMGVGIDTLFRLKNKGQRALALSYGIATIVAGTSELTIYGIYTEYKKPSIGPLAGGFSGGACAGLTDAVGATLTPSSNIFATLYSLRGSQVNVIDGIIACAIAFIPTTLLVYFFGPNEGEKGIQRQY